MRGGQVLIPVLTTGISTLGCGYLYADIWIVMTYRTICMCCEILLIRLPAAILWCSLLMAITVTVVLGIYRVYSRWSAQHPQANSNEFIGAMFGAVGLIYSLLIAFVIITVWDNYEQLNQTVENEADKLQSLLSHTTVLPDSMRIPLHKEVLVYCSTLIGEWQRPENARFKQVAAIPKIRLLLFKMQPQNRMQQDILKLVEDEVDDISDLRNARLNHTRSHVPTLVWVMLLEASAMVISFSFFIHAPSVKLKQLGLSFLSAIIAMSIFLIYTLDNPFTSSLVADNKPYQMILMQLKTSF